MDIFFKRTTRFFTLICILGTLVLSSTSCTVHRTGHQHGTKVPPGQAKKYHGDRSAKRYAPGQQKGKKNKPQHKDKGRKKDSRTR